MISASLILYARFHFFAEESLMINSAYPDADGHMREHALVMSTFEKKIDEYFRNPETGEALGVFIFDWLVLHTLDVDKKLATYLLAHQQRGRVSKP